MEIHLGMERMEIVDCQVELPVGTHWLHTISIDQGAGFPGSRGGRLILAVSPGSTMAAGLHGWKLLFTHQNISMLTGSSSHFSDGGFFRKKWNHEPLIMSDQSWFQQCSNEHKTTKTNSISGLIFTSYGSNFLTSKNWCQLDPTGRQFPAASSCSASNFISWSSRGNCFAWPWESKGLVLAGDHQDRVNPTVEKHIRNKPMHLRFQILLDQALEIMVIFDALQTLIYETGYGPGAFPAHRLTTSSKVGPGPLFATAPWGAAMAPPPTATPVSHSLILMVFEDWWTTKLLETIGNVPHDANIICACVSSIRVMHLAWDTSGISNHWALRACEHKSSKSLASWVQTWTCNQS